MIILEENFKWHFRGFCIWTRQIHPQNTFLLFVSLFNCIYLWLDYLSLFYYWQVFN